MRSHKSKSANKRLAGVVRLLSLIALAALLFIALPGTFGAAGPIGFQFTVTTVDDHDDGSCDGGDCTLREAIQAANNAPTADTIDFNVKGTISLTSALPVISDDVEIIGPGAKALTVSRNVSATSRFRIFNVTTTGTVIFSGLTLTGGLALSPDDEGGGIRNEAGTVTVNNCRIFENTASLGGGIFNNGRLNVNDSIIEVNHAASGGGLFNSDLARAIVNRSTITLNNGNEGGGIESFGNSSTLNITNSTISENNANEGSGGGILNLFGGAVNISRSTIDGNRADGAGGGIFNTSGPVTIFNSTISNNDSRASTSAPGRGGGIINFNGTVEIEGSTITGNSAPTGGGIDNASTFDGVVNLINSTLSNNTAVGGGGIHNSSLGTINVINSTIGGNAATGNPGFGFGGGGIENESGGTVDVKCTILAVNTAAAGPNVSGEFVSQGFNLIGITDGSNGFTASTDLTGSGASPLNPKFETDSVGNPLLKDNGGPTKTIALLCDSPAIDKGTSGLLGFPNTDQRGTGFPRTVDDPLIPNASGGDGTDIGAFEVQGCNHPPVALCRNIQISANNNCQATINAADVDNGSFDPDQGDSIANRTLDNSGPFGLGTHAVILTITDTHGASSSCTASVTVVDTTPPALTCPPNQSVPAVVGQCQAVVSYPDPTVTDNCSGSLLLGCAPPSGTIFQVGTTTVTCTARDAANNIGTCQFMVMVLDTQPPIITCPPNIVTKTANPGDTSVIVTYPPATASDNCGNVAVVCSPPTGSSFPRGTTTVTCSATDAANIATTCTFTVTVFDVCVQDETTQDALLFDSQSGDYLYLRCGADGFTLIGRGIARVHGSIFTLEHNASDRRVIAKIDDSAKKGTASVQLFALGNTFIVTDRNIADNTCSCP